MKKRLVAACNTSWEAMRVSFEARGAGEVGGWGSTQGGCAHASSSYVACTLSSPFVLKVPPMARPLARVLLIERVGVIEFDKSTGPGSVFPAAAYGRHANAMASMVIVIMRDSSLNLL